MKPKEIEQIKKLCYCAGALDVLDDVTKNMHP